MVEMPQFLWDAAVELNLPLLFLFAALLITSIVLCDNLVQELRDRAGNG